MTPTRELCRLKVAPLYVIGLCKVFFSFTMSHGKCHKTLPTLEYPFSVDMDPLRLGQDFQLGTTHIHLIYIYMECQGISVNHTNEPIYCALIDIILH